MEGEVGFTVELPDGVYLAEMGEGGPRVQVSACGVTGLQVGHGNAMTVMTVTERSDSAAAGPRRPGSRASAEGGLSRIHATMAPALVAAAMARAQRASTSYPPWSAADDEPRRSDASRPSAVATARVSSPRGVVTASAEVDGDPPERDPRADREPDRPGARRGEDSAGTAAGGGSVGVGETGRRVGSAVDDTVRGEAVLLEEGTARLRLRPPGPERRRRPVETIFSEDDPVTPDDLLLAGRPVDDLGRTRPVRPFRLGRSATEDAVIGGAFVRRRCYCHGALGRSRFCPSVMGDEAEGLWYESVEGLRRLAIDAPRFSPTRLFRAIVSSAVRLIRDDPGADRILGDYYSKTAGQQKPSLGVWYAACPDLCPAVSLFLREHTAAVDRVVEETMARMGEDGVGRGLLSTVCLLDRVAGRSQGVDETQCGIFVRTAAFLAVECGAAVGDVGRILSDRPGDPVSRFSAFFQALVSYAIVLPEHVLAVAGWRESRPLFSAADYRPRGTDAEETMNGAVGAIVDLLCNGVEVSARLADLPGDDACTLRALDAQVCGLASGSCFAPRLRILADLWSLSALEVLAFLAETPNCSLEFALAVPSAFWERHVAEDGRRPWTLFPRREAEALKRADGPAFRRLYERLESTGAGVEVSSWWLVNAISSGLASGRVAVVSPHNVVQPVPGDPVRFEPGGPDLSALTPTTPGVYALHPVYVNIDACVLREEEGEPEADDEDGLRRGEYRIDFAVLRRRAQEAAVIGDLLMNATMRDNAFGAGESVGLHRPLQVGIVGLHDAVTRLGWRYGEPAAQQFDVRVCENVYFGVVRASVDMCAYGAPAFPRFLRSLMAAGKFAFDMRNGGERTTLGLSWDVLRNDALRYGVRNAVFVALGDGESAARVAGVSAGVGPRPDNYGLYPSPLRAFPARQIGLRRGDERAARLRLSAAELSEQSRLLLVSPEPVRLPAVNRVLAGLPRERAVRVLRLGTAAGLGERDASRSEEEDDGVYVTAWGVHPEVTLGMCVARQRFVDQGQAWSLCLGAGRSVVELGRHARRAHGAGLPLGIYKCRVGPGAAGC